MDPRNEVNFLPFWWVFLAVCSVSNGFGSCEVHGEFGVEDQSQVFKLEYLSNIRARGGGWEGCVDVEGG